MVFLAKTQLDIDILALNHYFNLHFNSVECLENFFLDTFIKHLDSEKLLSSYDCLAEVAETLHFTVGLDFEFVEDIVGRSSRLDTPKPLLQIFNHIVQGFLVLRLDVVYLDSFELLLDLLLHSLLLDILLVFALGEGTVWQGVKGPTSLLLLKMQMDHLQGGWPHLLHSELLAGKS